MRKTITAVLFIFLGLPLFAQQVPLPENYLFNPYLMNPAVAGTERKMPISLLSSKQWMQMNNGPSLTALSVHRLVRNSRFRFTPGGYINKGKNETGNVGIGGMIYNYSIGAFSYTGFSLTYAYHITLDHTRLSFGLSPTFTQYKIDKTGFTLPDNQAIDPLIHQQTIEAVYVPDANVGMHLYNDNLSAGFAIHQLFRSSIQIGSFSYESLDEADNNPDLDRNIILYAGYRFRFNRFFSWEPSAYLQTTFSGLTAYHINSKFYLSDTYYIGASYRPGNAVIAFMGLEFDNLRFSYAYEQAIGDIANYGFSSHTIMLGFLLREKPGKGSY